MASPRKSEYADTEPEPEIRAQGFPVFVRALIATVNDPAEAFERIYSHVIRTGGAGGEDFPVLYEFTGDNDLRFTITVDDK